MIHFQDFVPEVTDRGGVFRRPTLEALSITLAKTNDWIANHDIKVVNIETVVLPNIHSLGEEGSADAQLHTSGDMASSWHQFIRVWYQSQ